MRVLLYITLCLSIIAGIFIYPVSRNWVIKKTIENIASSSNMRLQIGNLDAGNKKIVIKDTKIIANKITAAEIEDIIIDYDLHEMIGKKELVAHINIGGKTNILGSDTILLANIDYQARSLKKYNLKINLEKFSTPIFGEFGMNLLSGQCSIITNSRDKHISDCMISDGTLHFSTLLKTNFHGSKLKSILFTGKIQELPMDLHKLFHHLIPPNEAIKYVYDNIYGAKIKNGKWELKLGEEFFNDFHMKPEYLNGEFNIANINLRYDPDLPALEKINTKLALNGSTINFDINEAYSNKTKLTNGNVFIDWGAKDIEIIVKADALGPVANLTDFIPLKDLKSLKDSGIDLTKFKGIATSKVNITIPLSDEESKYNITTKISNAALSIYNENVRLTAANLEGIYDGDHVKINGSGLINGFKSEIDFLNNLLPQEAYDNILNIKLKLTKQNINNIIPFYAFDDGAADLNITYKDKNDKAEFEANSNLTDIGFNIAKLGIYTSRGSKAILNIRGKKEENGTFPLDININGTNINIIGKAILGSKTKTLSFSKIKNNDTNIKAEIEFAPKLVKTKIWGSFIDYSNSNMMQFLTKDASDIATNINVKFDTVKLKNDILLGDFILSMKCGRTKCTEGIMNANIGTKTMGLMLYPHDDYEEWKVNITNAGAAFKGFDMINNIKSGDLFMTIKTNIKNAEKGKAVPIAEGNFSLTKFVTVDNKILTRLVSFVSLPGIMSTITNNKNISFTEMKGKFSYKDNIINIYDTTANGPFFDLTVNATVYTDKHKTKVKGTVIPSLYGINNLVNKIPVLGTIFGGKHRKGLLSAPYSLEYKY